MSESLLVVLQIAFRVSSLLDNYYKMIYHRGRLQNRNITGIINTVSPNPNSDLAICI